MREIRIYEDVLQGMTILASKKDIRYYLNGVLVDVSPTWVRLVATDGHLLGLFQQHEGVDGEPVQIIIPNEVIAKLNKKAGDHWLRQDAEGKWSIDNIGFVPLDGKFPDYMRVIPKEELSNQVAQFNPEFIGRFAKVAKTVARVKIPIVQITHNGQSSALVDIGIPDRFIGVVMPLRLEGGFKKAPAWLGLEVQNETN